MRACAVEARSVAAAVRRVVVERIFFLLFEWLVCLVELKRSKLMFEIGSFDRCPCSWEEEISRRGQGRSVLL